MTPQEAKRLVGHHSSPQPEADLVERLRERHELGSGLSIPPTDLEIEAADEIEQLRASVGHWSGAAVEKLAILASENDRLRCALRAVRACTDPAWQLRLIKDALREGEGT